jgi:prepilin-type N-terminal cleavage/methylation domain-containing protein
MRRASGFTLLEVLAAVAVLAIVYVLLSRVAIQGMRHEGESSRRLEASLLIDLQLYDLEAQLDRGFVPSLGRTESELDDFQVALEVEAFALQVPEEFLDAGGGEGAPPSLIGSGRSPDESLLRRVTLRVSWFEGVDERSVERTTFGVDLSPLQTALPALGALGAR